MTSIQSFENLRKLILDKTLIKELIPLEMGTFAEASVVPIVLIFKKEEDRNKILKNQININKLKDGIFFTDKKISQKSFLENKGYVFSFSLDSSESSIFEKLKKKSINLGDIAKFSLGIKSADNEKFVSFKRTDSSSKKVLKGKYIGRYHFSYQGEWIWYNPKEMMKRKGAGPRKAENFEVPEKIILQEISGDKIVAALDTNQYFCLDTCNILY